MEKNDVNIAVIYYSSTGTIYRIAQEIAGCSSPPHPTSRPGHGRPATRSWPE
jgi:hypothetical protein